MEGHYVQTGFAIPSNSVRRGDAFVVSDGFASQLAAIRLNNVLRGLRGLGDDYSDPTLDPCYVDPSLCDGSGGGGGGSTGPDPFVTTTDPCVMDPFAPGCYSGGTDVPGSLNYSATPSACDGLSYADCYILNTYGTLDAPFIPGGSTNPATTGNPFEDPVAAANTAAALGIVPSQFNNPQQLIPILNSLVAQANAQANPILAASYTALLKQAQAAAAKQQAGGGAGSGGSIGAGSKPAAGTPQQQCPQGSVMVSAGNQQLCRNLNTGQVTTPQQVPSSLGISSNTLMLVGVGAILVWAVSS